MKRTFNVMILLALLWIGLVIVGQHATRTIFSSSCLEAGQIEKLLRRSPYAAISRISCDTLIEILMYSVSNHIKKPDYALILARIYTSIGRPDDTLRLIQGLPELNVEQLIQRANLYALIFEFDAAIDDINTAIELDDFNPELYVQHGNIMMLLYEWDQAFEDYNRAITIDPSYSEAYYRRGILYYSLLERDPALNDFEAYLNHPTDGAYSIQAAHYAEKIKAELEALSTP